MIWTFFIASILIAILAPDAHSQAAAGERYAIVIGGLGGSPEHTDKFKGYLYDTRKALVDQFQFDDSNVAVLGEKAVETEPYVDNLSNAENIRVAFADMAAKLTENDHLYVFLFGHGGYDNGSARLNIPRRDLSQADFAELVDSVPAGRIVFINSGSASAPFIEALSGEGRMVMTATRSGTQKNETNFPRFMLESFSSPGTDRDKDGRISVAEVFLFSAEKTDQWFKDNGHIPTENALLDDNGDGEGHRVNELEEAGEGHLAAITYLSPGAPAIASTNRAQASGWLQEKEQIELEIAALKSKKSNMDVDDYYDQLEVLFVRLARGNN